MDLQFALGQAFYKLSLEEKFKYIADLDAGNYTGYRPAGRRPLPGGVPEKIEMWNMSSMLSSNLVVPYRHLSDLFFGTNMAREAEDGQIRQSLPKPLDNYRDEIKDFSKVKSPIVCKRLKFLILWNF